MKGWDEKVVELADMVAPGFLDDRRQLDESEHFYTCHYCDQAVDIRVLAEVQYHDRPGHSPRARG